MTSCTDATCLACAYHKELTLVKELTDSDTDHVYVSKDRWDQLEALFPDDIRERRKQIVYECGVVSLYHPRAMYWFTHLQQYRIERLELPHEEDQEILIFLCSPQERYGTFVGRIWPARHTNEK